MKSLLVFLLVLPFFAGAQATHTVGPKETLFSLAREFNVHPRELAAYNNIPYDKGLAIGQVIKIPAHPTMAPLGTPAPSTNTPIAKPEPITKTEPIVKKEPLVKKEVATNESVLTPIYHKVAKKETLYHISVLYNKVPIADLKKWNKLTGDGVSEGTNLIVGYTRGANNNTVSTTPVEEITKPVVTKTEPVKAKEAPVKQPEEEPKISPAKETTSAPEPKEAATNTGKRNFEGGYFKTTYNNQGTKRKEETGTAGIFKSTSGWEDGKYYCLHNSAPAGSIIRITNNTTRKSVYAKVLDVIPDLKQNSGVLIRISNAAADELGVTDNFECTLNF